jgi:hypothetical protein
VTPSLDAGDSFLNFTGGVAAVNVALSVLRYRGDANYVGDDVITLTVTDDGFTGAGTPVPLSDLATLAIQSALRVCARNTRVRVTYVCDSVSL